MAEKGPEWTPGPWKTRGPEVVNPDGRVVASLQMSPLAKVTVNANLSLIESAPTLWHACVGLLKSLEDAARNNPEAWLEFINEIALDLPKAMATASAAIQKALRESKGRPAIDTKEIH